MGLWYRCTTPASRLDLFLFYFFFKFRAYRTEEIKNSTIGSDLWGVEETKQQPAKSIYFLKWKSFLFIISTRNYNKYVVDAIRFDFFFQNKSWKRRWQKLAFLRSLAFYPSWNKRRTTCISQQACVWRYKTFVRDMCMAPIVYCLPYLFFLLLLLLSFQEKRKKGQS